MSFDIPNVRVKRESDKALLVEAKKRDGFPMEFWVPKSVIDDDSEVFELGTYGKLIVADWWAVKEKLDQKV